MNFRNRHSTALFVCCAFVLLIIAPAGANGRVLCVSADGHVSIEPSTDGQCCEWETGSEDVQQSTAISLGKSSESDHCGTCIDVPLSNTAGDTRLSRAPGTRPASILPIATIQPTGVFTPAAAAIQIAQAGRPVLSRSDNSLLSLSTVNLLI